MSPSDATKDKEVRVETFFRGGNTDRQMTNTDKHAKQLLW